MKEIFQKAGKEHYFKKLNINKFIEGRKKIRVNKLIRLQDKSKNNYDFDNNNNLSERERYSKSIYFDQTGER